MIHDEYIYMLCVYISEGSIEDTRCYGGGEKRDVVRISTTQRERKEERKRGRFDQKELAALFCFHHADEEGKEELVFFFFFDSRESALF